MRRISGRSVALALTLVAFAAWSAKTFARDVDEDNPRSATGDETSWSSDLEGSNQANQNQNQNRNRQNRNQDSDQQHHAALGITMDDSDGSVRVATVLQGSPAARAGVQVGDEIRSVDGDRIRTADGLADEIGDKRPGARIELGIRRNGERHTLQVRLGTQDELYGRNFRSGRGNTGGYAANEDANNRSWQNGQNNRNRNRSSSYDPNSQGGNLNEQVRALQQQVAQLQRQLDELRNQQGNNARVSSRNRADNDRNQNND